VTEKDRARLETMNPRRRLLARGPLLFDLSPQRLILFDGAEGVRREAQGDVRHSHLPVVLAALDEAKNVWVGDGDQRVFSLGEGGRGTAQELPGRFCDLTTQGDRLVGVRLGGDDELRELVVSDASAREWRLLRMPKPVAARPVPHYTLDGRVRSSPDGVILETNRFGVTVLEKGRGRVYVLRPGAPALEGGLKLQPGSDQDTWRALATPQGVLLLLVANHRHTALAHFALDGTLLGSVSERGDRPLWGGVGLCVLDETRALVFCEETLLVSLPGLEVLETLENEWRDSLAVAPAGPGRWWLGTEDQDDLTLLTVAPGESPRFTASKRPVVPGPPLKHVGYTQPKLDWEAGASSSLTVSAPVAETYRLTLRNVGAACDAVRLCLSSPLIGARVVDARATWQGAALALTGQNRVDLVGEGGGLAQGATAELLLTFTPRGVGEAPVSITAEPLLRPPGMQLEWAQQLDQQLRAEHRGASTRVALTVE